MISHWELRLLPHIHTFHPRITPENPREPQKLPQTPQTPGSLQPAERSGHELWPLRNRRGGLALAAILFQWSHQGTQLMPGPVIGPN